MSRRRVLIREGHPLDWRQLLTNRVIAEGLVVARLERQQAHYEEVLRHLQYAQVQSGAANPDIEVLRIQSGLEETFAAVARVVEHMNALYEELSAKNLNPATLLYSVSSPFTQSTERSVPERDLASYGLLILVMTHHRAGWLPRAQLLSAGDRSPGDRRAACCEASNRCGPNRGQCGGASETGRSA